MTEAEWWAARDLVKLAGWLIYDTVAADRKLRLFSVACCAPLRDRVTDQGVLAALDLAAAFADGRIDRAALDEAIRPLWQNFNTRYTFPLRGAALALARVAHAEFACLHTTTPDVPRGRDGDDGSDPYLPVIAAISDQPGDTHASFPRKLGLLHDIFGPLPFREVAVEPAWLTADVLALARGIYDEKAFDRMPILADALQDAGCADDEVLSHCRQPNWEHVRGCWVLDLLLGRPWREEPPAIRRAGSVAS
jgi:hypothetical protein